jgi:hypothetical protein
LRFEVDLFGFADAMNLMQSPCHPKPQPLHISKIFIRTRFIINSGYILHGTILRGVF